MTEERRRRLDRAFAMGEPIVGTASDLDGAVTVEVGVGGRVLSVRLRPRALRYGASYLAQAVLSTAAKATAGANQQAHQMYAQALGTKGGQVAERLGLGYDRVLAEDEPRCGADDDFPDRWMSR